MCPSLVEMSAYIGAHPELGLQVIGYVDDGEAAPHSAGAGKLLGPINILHRIAAESAADRLVVGFGERRGQMPIADLLQLRYGGMAIDEAAAAYEQLCGRVLLGELRPAEMLLGAFRPRAKRMVYQTIAHWLLASILTILSAPLLLLAVLLLKLSSHGPAIPPIRLAAGGRRAKPECRRTIRRALAPARTATSVEHTARRDEFRWTGDGAHRIR
jgi:hypothetical protein